MQMMDGKALAQKILAELKNDAAALTKRPRLAVVVVGQDPVIRSFIAEKKRAAEAVDVDVRVYECDTGITTNELRKRVAEIVHEKRNTAVIIQLPLPAHINKQYILNAIPPEKDADVLSARAVGNFAVGKSPIVPPVVGAIKTLLGAYGVGAQGKHAVLIGAGALVGRPAALWLLGEHGCFTVIGDDAAAHAALIREGDIVISGVGKPGLITGDMIREGAVVIDAGTSESEGKMVGDVDSASVGERASYLAPVPGGIGPLTVAMLLKNVLILAQG